MKFTDLFDRFTKDYRQVLRPKPLKRPAVTLSPEDPDTPVYVDGRPVQVKTDRAAARNDLRVYAVAGSVLRW